VEERFNWASVAMQIAGLLEGDRNGRITSSEEGKS
jgi:hypothetical protein